MKKAQHVSGFVSQFTGYTVNFKTVIPRFQKHWLKLCFFLSLHFRRFH